jgi:hypothetical protein
MLRNKTNNTDKIKLNLKSSKVYVLGGICAILAVFSIFLTIEAATSGAEIAELQKKEAQLLTQRQDLQESLVESLSVNSLQEKSIQMGFTKVGNLVYVSSSVPVASLPNVNVGQ